MNCPLAVELHTSPSKLSFFVTKILQALFSFHEKLKHRPENPINNV